MDDNEAVGKGVIRKRTKVVVAACIGLMTPETGVITLMVGVSAVSNRKQPFGGKRYCNTNIS